MANDTDKLYDAVRGLPFSDEPGWDQLSTAQQQFVSMFVVEGQVFNGGFPQLYSNECDSYLPAALAGYRAIGAKPQVEIVEQVMAMVRDDPWSGPSDTWPDPDAEEPPPGSKTIEVFDDQWSALDGARLDRIKLWYLNAHPDDFRHPTRPGPTPP